MICQKTKTKQSKIWNKNQSKILFLDSTYQFLPFVFLIYSNVTLGADVESQMALPSAPEQVYLPLPSGKIQLLSGFASYQ